MENLHNAFMINLSPHYGLISVSGPDAFTFLQGQLTCDMALVMPGKSILGAFCNPKGRVRAIFRIFCQNERYFLYLPLSVLAQTLDSLKKYGRFSKVSLQDESKAYLCWGVSSPDAEDRLKALKDHPNVHISTSISRFVLIGTQEAVISMLEQKKWLQNFATEEGKYRDFEAWKLLDIENLIPEIWSETIEQFLPHDIGLIELGAVSFKKGCYCGQEIIARMEYRGKSKKHVIRKSLDSIDVVPIPGSEVDNGIVISSCKVNKYVEVLLQYSYRNI